MEEMNLSSQHETSGMLCCCCCLWPWYVNQNMQSGSSKVISYDAPWITGVP